MKVADILTANLREKISRLRAAKSRLVRPAQDLYKDDIPYEEIKRLQAILPLEDYIVWARQQQAQYDARAERYKAAERIYWNKVQIIDQELHRLKGQIRYANSIGTPSGLFSTYELDPFDRQNQDYIDAVGRIIDKANEDMPEPAASVIVSFVGHYPRANEHMIGVWSQDQLEDTFSDNPQKEDHRIARQQLEQAMRPIRDMLRQRFGDTITLYRAQYRLKGTENPRNVLSWTASPKFAKLLAGEDRDILTQEMPLENIIWITDRANQQEFICRV